MLSAFFRNQFPHLTVAAVAGSAPILAQLDFPEYDMTVKNVLAKYPSRNYKNCSDAIQNAFLKLLDYTSNRRDYLVSSFNICEKLNFYTADLISAVSGFMQGVVQTNNADNNYPAQSMCSFINQYVTAFDGLVNYVGKQLSGQCLVTNPFPDSFYNISSDRSWLFQTCTEYGFYQTDVKSGIFGSLLDINYYLNICSKLFGTNLIPDIDTTNYYFGGITPGGDNVLYTNGLNDPWANLGLVKNTSKVLVYLYDGAHCAPFHKSSAIDPPSLINVRMNLKNFVSNRLKEDLSLK